LDADNNFPSLRERKEEKKSREKIFEEEVTDSGNGIKDRAMTVIAWHPEQQEIITR